jgi:hypothetical protein
MRKISILLFCILLSVGISAQRRRAMTVQISYSYYEGGKLTTENGIRKLMATDTYTKAWTDKSDRNLISVTPKEAEYVSFIDSLVFNTAELNGGNKIYTSAKFTDYPIVTVTDDTTKILNYPCKKASCVINSNKIEIWFTTEMGFKGSPRMGYGLVDGMVLRVLRNGNSEILADKIEFFKDAKELMPKELGTKMENAVYRSYLTNSFITTIPIFKDDQLSWGNKIENPKGEVLDSIYRFAGGTIILKKVKLPKFSSDYQVFAELTQYSNGDAYDRTGSIFIIPTDKEKSLLTAMLSKDLNSIPIFEDKTGKKYYGTSATSDFSPIVELVRFFTPFGVRQYNDKSKVVGQTWENQAYYKEEITELLPKLQGEVWIGAYIGNYDKGGHKISLDLKYYPNSDTINNGPDKKVWIYPAFSTVNVLEMAGGGYGTLFETDSLKIEVNVPKGVKNITLRYLSTGHGGWDGGDEFNKKVNYILVDDKLQFSYIPWRTDCGTFRKYNPASGNFWNGTSSSDYSRSGWCPGSSSEPMYIPMTNLTEGKHIITIAIPMGKPEGGSVSSWNISGVLIGEY